jgi:hypothetical protein
MDSIRGGQQGSCVPETGMAHEATGLRHACCDQIQILVWLVHGPLASVQYSMRFDQQ